MLVFNGYLTWRPVVLYGEAYQLGLRIYTIPIEDFGYGYALILLCRILYEFLKRRQHG
jgi:lycopene cyclase domain-containing protein